MISSLLVDRFRLAPDSILNEFQEFKMVSPNKTSVLYSHSSPFAYVVDREKFDNNLADEAVSNGVALKLSHEVVDVLLEKNYANITVKMGHSQFVKFRAKAIILATGIDTRLNKKLGLGYSSEYIHGIQAEIPLKQNGYPEIFVPWDSGGANDQKRLTSNPFPTC